jgi:hypothetical protein
MAHTHLQQQADGVAAADGVLAGAEILGEGARAARLDQTHALRLESLVRDEHEGVGTQALCSLTLENQIRDLSHSNPTHLLVETLNRVANVTRAGVGVRVAEALAPVAEV